MRDNLSEKVSGALDVDCVDPPANMSGAKSLCIPGIRKNGMPFNKKRNADNEIQDVGREVNHKPGHKTKQITIKGRDQMRKNRREMTE